MSVEEAWAVGIIEGEGCFILRPNARSGGVYVSMTDLDILKRLQALWGGQIYIKRDRQTAANPHWKQAWQWHLGKKPQVKAVVSLMLPLLGERRACKALDLLDHLDGV